jgi:hypothetical protein
MQLWNSLITEKRFLDADVPPDQLIQEQTLTVIAFITLIIYFIFDVVNITARRLDRGSVVYQRRRKALAVLLDREQEETPAYDGSVPEQLLLRGAPMLYIYTLGFGILGLLLSNIGYSLSPFWAYVCLAIWEILCLLFLIGIPWMKYVHLDVQQQGLAGGTFNNTAELSTDTHLLLPFQEARLFLSYRMRTFTGQPYILYELLSASKSVTWKSMPERPSFLAAWRPVGSYASYNRKIEEINAYVKARTGLMLYDLSEDSLPEQAFEMQQHQY